MDSYIMTRIQVSVFILLFVTLAGANGGNGVHINRLSVPPIIKNGTLEYIILDCDYSITDDSRQGLVVKWFFNNSNNVVYQWIANEIPRSLGVLRDKVDLSYKASQEDYKMHRALRILRPSVELTGEWLCQVSTFNGESVKRATMLVYAPEKDMGIKVVPRQSVINVSCWASGVYPEPKIVLYQGENKEHVVADPVIDVEFNEDNHSFNVRAYKTIENANLSFSNLFECELHIPEANYFRRKTAVYEPGSMALRDSRSANGGFRNGVDYGPITITFLAIFGMMLTQFGVTRQIFTTTVSIFDYI